MSDSVQKFIEEMRSYGVGPSDPSKIIDDDKVHRYHVEGDKPRSENGVYQLGVQPDGFAFGWYMSHKEGVTRSWHTKAKRNFSDEEKAAWKRRIEDAKREREEQSKRIAAEAAVKAAGIWSSADTTGTTEYLERKGAALHGCRISRGSVVVPIWNGGKLVGLQFIAADGAKRFLSGTPMEGSYFAIAAKGDDLSRILICEGFSTGAALRRALGLPVIVAFNAGNLKPVAKAMREKYPDAVIEIAADNDLWLKKPDGTPYNIGLEKARQAAAAIGGARVIFPSVEMDDEERRTDWDDIARTEGDDVLREAFQPVAQTAEPVVKPSKVAKQDDPLSRVRPLGHDNGRYYFFPVAKGQISSFSATDLGRIQNLYSLASKEYWEAYYSDGGEFNARKVCDSASAHLIQACHEKGIFRPEQTRGVGAWMEDGRAIVNCGDYVLDNGDMVKPAEYVAKNVYESGPAVFKPGEPIGNAEASKLRDICRKLRWKNPIYGDMLAGWLVIAPVGSALKWRPHIWITGKSGAGKSTVLTEIVKPVMGTAAISREGGTTEAGVRKAIGSSGRPYILDEFESETIVQRQETAKILFLARRASSGGIVENNNMVSQVRNCFCFSAINPAVEQTADKGRITFLELSIDDQPGAKERFAELLAEVHATITPEFAEGLLGRTVENLDNLIKNVETFTVVAAEHFGNRRLGDQIGPMIAGSYSLTSKGLITIENAKKWIEGHKWDWHTSSSDESDVKKLMDTIMTRRIRYDMNGINRERTISDMIEEVVRDSEDHLGVDACIKGLRSYGIRIIDQWLVIANNSPNLREVLKDTPYIPWDRSLKDWEGADHNDNKPVHFGAFQSKVTRIPLVSVVQDATYMEGDVF